MFAPHPVIMFTCIIVLILLVLITWKYLLERENLLRLWILGKNKFPLLHSAVPPFLHSPLPLRNVSILMMILP